jgi:hypothetical protein
MSIRERLPRKARKNLKALNWTKELELAKLARKDVENFECATWVLKAGLMPKEEFKREVEKELAGQEIEPHEIIANPITKTQLPHGNEDFHPAIPHSRRSRTSS